VRQAVSDQKNSGGRENVVLWSKEEAGSVLEKAAHV